MNTLLGLFKSVTYAQNVMNPNVVRLPGQEELCAWEGLGD